MRHFWQSIAMVLCALLGMPALGEQNTLHWHQDLESAKVVAKETKRLLLIHFWTPSCGPCMALERNVFNQPGVAAAIEAQFVPVKLNADENSATAQWYGITRVPTDVVATPDGQIISKSVSPPTPAAYVAELTNSANKYGSRLGGTFAAAAGAAPVQSQLNSAYSKLPVAQSAPVGAPPQPAPVNPNMPMQAVAPPALPPTTFGNQSARGAGAAPSTSPNFATVPPPTLPLNPPASRPVAPAIPAMPVAQSIPAPATSASAYPQLAAPAPVPQTINNPAIAAPVAGAQPPITPIGATPTATAQVANPYLASASAASPAAMPPAQPLAAVQPQASAPPTFPTLNTQPAAPQFSRSNPAPSTLQPAVQPTMQPPATPNSVAAVASTSGDGRQLLPGSPPLAFDGYCPVSMRNNWKWVPGNPQYGIVHLGRTYWFAGPEEQKQFWTDPTRYAPALSGNDPVLAIDHQQQIPGKREHSLDYDGLFYMFASEATLQQFAASPSKYAAGVRQAMGLPRGRLVR